MKPRVAVLQFPGVNCEAETLRALGRVGLEAELFRWTRPAAELARFQAFVLPGGFSWQDRVRAGALAAKDPMVDVLAECAERGSPVLGICNGAQVLAEAGLVPGDRADQASGVGVSLARNRMPGRTGYYARWTYVRIEASPCLFTRDLAPATVLPLPVAHAEGRFTARDPATLADLVRAGQAPLRYTTADGRLAAGFPDNPDGAEAGVAALCNPRGNVLALMPHPERAQDLGAIARDIAGPWGGRRDWALGQPAAGGAGGTAEPPPLSDPDPPGPGLALFAGLARHLAEAG